MGCLKQFNFVTLLLLVYLVQQLLFVIKKLGVIKIFIYIVFGELSSVLIFPQAPTPPPRYEIIFVNAKCHPANRQCYTTYNLLRTGKWSFRGGGWTNFLHIKVADLGLGSTSYPGYFACMGEVGEYPGYEVLNTSSIPVCGF